MCFSVISQLTVSRSVFTAANVSDRTSAPAGADTQVFFAPEGYVFLDKNVKIHQIMALCFGFENWGCKCEKLQFLKWPLEGGVSQLYGGERARFGA